MGFFFVAVYALAMFIAASLLGVVPGFVLRFALPGRVELLLAPAVLLAVAWWIRVGWLGIERGASRIELVFYTGVAGVGFMRGWLWGIRRAERHPIRPGAARRRRASHRRTHPGGDRPA